MLPLRPWGPQQRPVCGAQVRAESPLHGRSSSTCKSCPSHTRTKSSRQSTAIPAAKDSTHTWNSEKTAGSEALAAAGESDRWSRARLEMEAALEAGSQVPNPGAGSPWRRRREAPSAQTSQAGCTCAATQVVKGLPKALDPQIRHILLQNRQPRGNPREGVTEGLQHVPARCARLAARTLGRTRRSTGRRTPTRSLPPDTQPCTQPWVV